ncbi:tripartite motif-containing protein 29-like isoform X2 [Perca flavescens]|nr:tripartite motif-containing protein 29-like isoform X2 [Perca flavescens]
MASGTLRPRLSVRCAKRHSESVHNSGSTKFQEENVDSVGSRKTSPIPLFEPEEIPCDICHGDKSPSVKSPSVKSPSVKSPSVKSPSVKSPSVKSCLVCQASYCELHLTPHLRDPALHRHQLTDPATFATSHLCRKHHKPLTMFCKKDQKPVCGQCTEREHKHHKTVPMEEENKRINVRKHVFH